ncbi:hypothetical protein [Nannocystis punicea]|uniref:Uncharacterized protein n=1 Tax=Nannocystis punicea TaxID=2995304 RepID=A0ABY7GUK5_9BACT|nr:hypothetical protein [Nannocystis poenicansa]WAS90636.1 hypothetical protein O0S08_30990 [Nannocystis poenicansa]
MKNAWFYVGALFLVALSIGRGGSAEDEVAADNYNEECLHEGCDTEEVRELYSSYEEECIGEGCSKEEIVELGGTPPAALTMLRHFQDLGWTVREHDLQGLDCSFSHTETKCTAFVLWCKEFWLCPEGVHERSWSACGGCLG